MKDGTAAVVAWLRDIAPPVDIPAQADIKIPIVKDMRNVFEMSATFALTGSLLVRSYSSDIAQPEAVYARAIKNGKPTPLVPGTSAAGVLRHRAEHIRKTLRRSDHATLLTLLFGEVDATTQQQRAGRLWVDEEQIIGGISEVHARIRVDRLTGGVMPGALFDEQPL